MQTSDWTKILILFTVGVWILWDSYAYSKQGNLPTESWTVWKWSYRIPAIAFLVGVLCGHLFFQMAPPEQLSIPCAQTSK